MKKEKKKRKREERKDRRKEKRKRREKRKEGRKEIKEERGERKEGRGKEGKVSWEGINLKGTKLDCAPPPPPPAMNMVHYHDVFYAIQALISDFQLFRFAHVDGRCR